MMMMMMMIGMIYSCGNCSSFPRKCKCTERILLKKEENKRGRQWLFCFNYSSKLLNYSSLVDNLFHSCTSHNLGAVLFLFHLRGSQYKYMSLCLQSKPHQIRQNYPELCSVRVERKRGPLNTQTQTQKDCVSYLKHKTAKRFEEKFRYAPYPPRYHDCLRHWRSGAPCIILSDCSRCDPASCVG